MKTSNRLMCTVAVAAALAAVKAQGQNLTTTLNGFSPALAVNGTFEPTTSGGFFFDYPSGVMNFTGFDAFCVDPLQDLAIGETLVYQVQSPQSLVNYDTIARLIGGYLEIAVPSNEQAAALQWAIWEVTSDSALGKSLFDGDVRITTPAGQNIATLANDFLADAKNFTPATLTYLTSDTRQDIVTWNVIPEPTSAGLAVLSGLLLLRRRRR